MVLPADIRYNVRTSIYKFPENTFGKLTSNRVKNKIKYNKNYSFILDARKRLVYIWRNKYGGECYF